MNPTELAPWDLLGYFFTTKETFFNGPAQGAQLVAANNQRWGLMFAFGGNAGQSGISIVQNGTFLQGLILTTTNPVLQLNCRDNGPLPCMAWYASGGSAAVTVWELIGQNWPQDDNNHLPAITHPPAPFPTPAPVKGPGVNNDQGVLSYWRSLMQKIGGK